MPRPAIYWTLIPPTRIQAQLVRWAVSSKTSSGLISLIALWSMSLTTAKMKRETLLFQEVCLLNIWNTLTSVWRRSQIKMKSISQSIATQWFSSGCSTTFSQWKSGKRNNKETNMELTAGGSSTFKSVGMTRNQLFNSTMALNWTPKMLLQFWYLQSSLRLSDWWKSAWTTSLNTLKTFPKFRLTWDALILKSSERWPEKCRWTALTFSKKGKTSWWVGSLWRN